MQPFLALITPVGGNGGGGSPPGFWGGGNVPMPNPPIYLPPQGGGAPPGFWGGGNVPMPSPPIANVPGAPGYAPPVHIWGPTDPRPGYGLPGPQPHPEHPIFYPPVIWGPNDPRPGYGLPGGEGEGGDKPPLIEWKTAWSPSTGWIVVGVPQVPHPVPSEE